MKTIAAFSNGEGGTLLIGVNNAQEAVGLEYDYSSLDDGRDEFEIHLRNLINSNFDINFAKSNLGITFHSVDDKDVCEIEIKRGNEPKHMELKSNSGAITEKFYVRSGNSSPEMPGSDAAAYIQSRFG